MAITCGRWLATGLILLVPVVCAGAFVPAPPDDAALKEKGLTRSGTTYVLPGESEVQKQINAVRKLSSAAMAAAAQKTQYEREVVAAQAEMADMEQQLIEINQALASGPPPAQQNQLAGMNNALAMRLNQMHREVSDDARQAVASRAAAAREKFFEAVLDLRHLVDETDAKYKTLGDDIDVTTAIESLNVANASKTPYVLGPSRGYRSNVALLEKIEASVLNEQVPVRKEGGVYWVDVTINGKLTRPMVFDTGAAAVVLPADLATQANLSPAPGNAVVKARVADGTEVEARRMIAKSLRVGKFTVENIECIVMTPDKKQVAPLLGQTFQSNFSIKFSADAGKLILAKLDEPTPKPSSERTKNVKKPRR